MADDYEQQRFSDLKSGLHEPLLQLRHHVPSAYETPQLGQFRKLENVPTNKSIFKLTAKELELFFNKENTKLPDNEGECRETLNILKACGYNSGLCAHLNTDPLHGILGDEIDLERRRCAYGVHRLALPKTQSYMTILYSQFEDPNIIFLTWAATIYLFFSFFSADLNHNGFIESLTIYVGLFFACILSASCDYVKEQQLLQLKDEVNNQKVIVYRGAYGTAASIPIQEIVVGDVVQISQGDRVPADCIILEEINLVVDQSAYGKKAADVQLKKAESNVTHDESGKVTCDNHKTNPDIVLLSDSKVMKGEARAIVCAVGQHTLLSRHRKKDNMIIKEVKTELEDRLDKISKSVEALAIDAMALCFFTQFVYALILIMISDDEKITLISNYTLMKVIRIAIIAICILIVAIPEGLALAVSVAMALSITKMKSDNIMIKNVEAVQKCAILHDICVSKTGTLTEGELHVASYQLVKEQMVHENDPVEAPSAFNEVLEVNVELKDLIKEAITMNTDARIEIGEDHDEQYKYLPRGQSLEVGMIDFLLENGEDVQNLFVKRNANCVKLIQFPFDPELKRKTVVRANATNPDTVRVYVKGAPEEVIPLCTMSVDVQVQRCEFDQADQDETLQKIADEIAAKGHKPLSYAFKEIDKERLQSLMDANAAQRSEDDSFRQEFESDLYYLGTFGLEDRIRPEIDEPINLIKYGHTDTAAETSTQVNVRLVSGDHLETCKAIALRTGIVKNLNELKMESTAMTGAQFREAIGPYQTSIDPETGATIIDFENADQFKAVKRRVRVIARATPEDKFLLIRGIQQQGGLIGMAGDSIADAEVLKLADVGLCMGKGCDVAKDHADLVILDNDFASVRRSILWGRAMFDNVRKFLQFQLTINFSLLSIVFITGATIGNIPFNVIQLLWMNLIMDILAAISLGTEPITEKSDITVTNKETRISRAAKIFQPGMWRTIIIQTIYQVVVILLLTYLGTFIFFDEPYNLITTPLREADAPTSKMQMDTIVFTTYFLMNMVNQISCRVVDDNELNPFKTLFNNPIFWVVFIVEMGVTHGMLFLGRTGFGTAVLGVTELTLVQYIVCWSLAILALPLTIAGKMALNVKKFEFLIHKFDLEPSVPRQAYVVKALLKLKALMLMQSTDTQAEVTPERQPQALSEYQDREQEDWANQNV